MTEKKENEREKVYIIQPIISENYLELHAEAISLLESTNAEYIGSSFQVIKEINPSTYVGSGKLAEIRYALSETPDATILFNGSLSPSQVLNISATLDDRKVIDRTTLILDIFAKNAFTSEGKYQVELAQLKYIYPRLKGKGEALSRLGGGIGSRGPGETKLETDRRHIKNRILYLENKLRETQSRRNLTVQRRKKQNVNTIALVGYTNTGKSTLFNLLTNANVLTKNALFATLDPTARNFTINDFPFTLIDTVGFLQDLPTSIIEAFKSTLEVAVNADLALIVADAQGNYEMQFKTTIDTLNELGFNGKYIKVLNKSEHIKDFTPFPHDCEFISAKNNIGIENLKQVIFKQFSDKIVCLQLKFSYEELSKYKNIREYIIEKNQTFDDYGLLIECLCEKKFLKYVDKFIV